jgi:hypothetical protein
LHWADEKTSAAPAFNSLVLQFSFAQETDSSAQHKSWIVHAEVSAFFIPGDFYLNPVAWVKKNHLHLEAR